jgi:MFS family permease
VTKPDLTPGAYRQLAVLALAMVLGMTPWFSATVAAPGMMAEWGATPSVSAWLTIAVQLGFVLGTFVSAVLLLSDRLSARRLASGSSFVVTIATAALAWRHTGPTGAIILSGFTGVALAGVYPPGIKIVAGWWRAGRGTAIGILVGALTIGSAMPNLLRAVAPVEKWRSIILAAASCALVSAVLFGRAVRDGPFQAASAPFNPRALSTVVRNRWVALATAGYLGHMWELYAMWSSIGAFWAYVIAPRAMAAAFAPVFAFVTVASGAVGCVVAGLAADRVGRPIVTIVAMAISATCALAIGFLATAPLVVVTVVAVVWGISIVADSAQFSAAITELAPSQYVGTAITLQTCLGFLLTIVTIRLVPVWVHLWGWELAYVPLAIGPAAGILAMWPLWRARSRGAS